MELWNSFSLPPPPVLSYKLICDNPKVVVNRLLGICDAVCRCFQNVHSVNAEAAVLSRIIYRMKLKFRNDKGFKALQKLNRVIRNTLVIDTNGVFNEIQNTLGGEYGPTRQMLEYTLVTLQSLAKLFDRIYNVSLEAGTYYRQRLKLGHNWGIALVVLSVLSRLWVLSQYIVRCACRWYNQLFQFLGMLQPSLTPWLPKGYHLPDDLCDWLDRPLYVMDNREHSIADSKDGRDVPSTSNKVVDIPLATKLTLEDDIGIPLTRDIFRPDWKTKQCKVPQQKKNNESLYTNHVKERKQIPSEKQIISSKLSQNKMDVMKHPVSLQNKEETMKHLSPSHTNLMEHSLPVQTKEGVTKHSLSLQTKKDVKKHSLSKIRCHSDLKEFIKTEKKLQKLKRLETVSDNLENVSKRFYTKDMDKLQTYMFNKEMKVYVRELKMIKDDKEKEAALIKTVKKRIKLWIK